MEQAADEIEALQHDVTSHMEIANKYLNEIEKLREALRPFARSSGFFTNKIYKNNEYAAVDIEITIGDLRKAAEILKENK